MDDRQTWDQGLRLINKMLAGLPTVKRQQLSEVLASYRQVKEELAAVVLSIDSEAVCRECRGQCCLNGKYRINVLDLISHCDAGISVSPDFAQKPFCPYGTVQGCLMEAGCRPFDCVIFICDELDCRLPDSARSTLKISEKKLRDCLDDASRLLDLPVATPLLIWTEKTALPINSK